ncbi:unnamed protein product [Coccothraustes coccothraustes]
MQVLRQAEDAYLELSRAKGRSRTVSSRSRALESTGTGTMLSGRRSRFFASANRRARPLLRREERSSTTLAISAQPSNSSRTVFFSTPRCKKLVEGRGKFWANFSEQTQFLLVRRSGKAFGENAGALTSRRRISGALRSEEPVPSGFQQEPRFGKHRHRHNAQCVKKPRLRFHQPESAAAAET